MPIKNYTTDVGEHRTVAEIQNILASKGARSIQIDYEDSRPSAVRFILVIEQHPVQFRLPCNFDGVFRALANRYKAPDARRRFEKNPNSKEQSRRVAWRIVKDWIDAQMAIVEAQQAALAQVFLPYAVMGKEGFTVYEQFLNSQKSLPQGSDA